jgi:signal peptidase I
MHFAIGLAIAAVVSHTWLLMGLFVPVTVSGSSMEPTLRPGQRLVVDRSAFTIRLPRRWEVVVFRCPNRADELCVKRIVGLPGESVALIDGEVFVNGLRVLKRVDDNWTSLHDGNPPGPDANPGGGVSRRPQSWQLGSDEYFVLGDNAAVSNDSRSWVPNQGLNAKLLMGKPLGVR